jgi:hypothetical protein
MSVIETTQYSVKTKDGIFKMFVSNHSDNLYHSGVLWYKKSGGFPEDVEIDLKLKSFVNTSSQEAYNEAQAWIASTLDANAVIS